MTIHVNANPDVKNPFVRVNSALQSWSSAQPWDKSAASSRGALGVVLANKQTLTTAKMAANSTCIEPENADSTHTIAAKVVAIDYESNPALLAPNNGDTENSFSGLKPLTLGGATKIGAKVEVWQLEDNGRIPNRRHATPLHF